MPVERRGRVTQMTTLANQALGGANDSIKALYDFQAGGLGGVPTGESQPGSRGCRWGDDRRLRAEPQREPLQDLEPDEFGELLPAAGPEGGDSQGRRTGPDPRGPDGGGSDRADGGQAVPGAGSGGRVPSRL